MTVVKRNVRPETTTSVTGNLLEWADNIADQVRDAGTSIAELKERIGGIKIIPTGESETIGINFESVVLKLQTVEGTFTVKGQNTIL